MISSLHFNLAMSILLKIVIIGFNSKIEAIQITFQDKVIDQHRLSFPYLESVLTFVAGSGEQLVSAGHPNIQLPIQVIGDNKALEIPPTYVGPYTVTYTTSAKQINETLTVDFVGCRIPRRDFPKCTEAFLKNKGVIKPGELICISRFNPEAKDPYETVVNFRSVVTKSMCDKLSPVGMHACLSDGTRLATVCEALLQYTHTNKITMETIESSCPKRESLTDSDFGWSRNRRCDKQKDEIIFYDSTYRSDSLSFEKFCVYCSMNLVAKIVHVVVRPLSHDKTILWSATLKCDDTKVQSVLYNYTEAPRGSFSVVIILVKKDNHVHHRIRSLIYNPTEVKLEVKAEPVCTDSVKTGALKCQTESLKILQFEKTNFMHYRWFLNNSTELPHQAALMNLNKEGHYHCKMVLYSRYCPLYDTDKIGPFETGASNVYSVARKCVEEYKSDGTPLSMTLVISFSVIIILVVFVVVGFVVFRKYASHKKNVRLFSLSGSMDDEAKEKECSTPSPGKTKSATGSAVSDSKIGKTKKLRTIDI